ncbi:ABC transporter ATP-binding protein [Alloscardovia venturai]|uniref:ABC transporter ATP-binding protein n=1 Tax=Alloscardovia venturai TaxID=1769421 RepID=A0ABW2Y709_9BIFI
MMQSSTICPEDLSIVCEHVNFSYGKQEILKDISFSVGKGVTGILGTNGAGKTTVLSILSTLKKPKSGHVALLGHDLSRYSSVEGARKNLGFLPQHVEVMNFSSVQDNVAYAAWAHGVDEKHVEEATMRALSAVNLEDKASVKARKLSGGQRQRLGIACTIAHNPQIIILDEPTVGVDPLQRNDLRNLILHLGQSRTVILSTHLVDDIARIAQTLLILNSGNLSYCGPLADLDEVRACTSQSPTDVAESIEHAFARLGS